MKSKITGKKVVLDNGAKGDYIARLDNIAIKDLKLIPEWNIVTRKITETIYSPDTDENGKRKVVGISTTIENTSVITLKPEEYYENLRNEGGLIAESIGKKIKEAG